MGALRLDKGRPRVDLVKAGFLFLRHCVFDLGGPLFTWQKTLPDEPESEASCLVTSHFGFLVYSELRLLDFSEIAVQCRQNAFCFNAMSGLIELDGWMSAFALRSNIY